MKTTVKCIYCYSTMEHEESSGSGQQERHLFCCTNDNNIDSEVCTASFLRIENSDELHWDIQN